MKQRLFLSLFVLFICERVFATGFPEGVPVDYAHMEPLKLHVDPMMRSMPSSSVLYSRNMDLGLDLKVWENRTNPGVKPYRFWDDMTFVGLPLFVAGIAIKGEKDGFRQNYDDPLHVNTRLVSHFHTSVDNYLQHFGPAMTVTLKAAGVEGRSSWPRLLATTAISYGTATVLVKGIKYAAQEDRPDNTAGNSWPSGHTALSFAGATILHKEYGLTRSPWYSVLGYSMATATGVLRVLNNRHWVSDVFSGAGIGILSTELAYALTDLLFKEKGLLRNDLENDNPSPSFIALSMGLGLGRPSLSFTPADLVDSDGGFGMHNVDVRFRTTTAVGMEGAYFFNKYIGVGGRFRVRVLRARQWSDLSDYLENDVRQLEHQMRQEGRDLTVNEEVTTVSDYLTEFSCSAGCYFNLPLNSHFALGSKLLVGRGTMQEMALHAHFQGHVEQTDYDTVWDFLTLGCNNQFTYGTGLSCTYHYKSNFLWRLFLDYDFTRRLFTLRYDPYYFLRSTVPDMKPLYENMDIRLSPYKFQRYYNMHLPIIGASLAVNF